MKKNGRRGNPNQGAPLFHPDNVAKEIAVALAEGIIDTVEAEALRAEALERQTGPLALLEERGILSPVTRLRLQAGGETISSTQTPDLTRYNREETCDDFPLVHSDRYQAERFLGQGGMGRVFLAWDTRLQRRVAIKFLRQNRQKDAKRLIREARAQARIQHERVCQVYEVLEEEGRVFIAMEYINGEPLSQRGGEWTLKTYIHLICDIALGLHAAHNAGLIHRDIKPGNIMVRTEGGAEPKAILMDFGLAMAWTEEDTLAWSAGTPSFMSPEQALGQEGCLDPRSDVYSLGASLYWCLCKRPPIMGKNSLDTISMIPNTEPPDPQSLNPEIKRDLALIIKKCLRKERADRYPSAKAFADDLQAYLRGDAVSVRGADWWYLTRKKLKQNKITALTTFAALVLMTALGLNTHHLNQQAELREKWARSFNDAAEEIEATIRYTHMLPAHDIRHEMKSLRLRLEDMEAMHQKAGPIADEAADWAIGRAYAAFDDHEAALKHLERAWRRGARQPALAYAIAQSRGELYNQARLAADNVSDTQRRERILADIETRYSAPALALLQTVPPSSTRFPSYVQAQMAWFAKNPRRALEILRQNAFQPWFYENYELQGLLYFNLSKQLRYLGHQSDAEECFQKSRHALLKAIDIAPSSIDTYLNLARILALQYDYHSIRPGDHTPFLRDALGYAETALRIDPDHVEARLFRARVNGLSFLEAINQGSPIDEALTRELDSVAEILAQGYERSDALITYMRLLCIRAQTSANQTEDPMPPLRQLWQIAERVGHEARSDNYYLILGQAYQIAGNQDIDHDETKLAYIQQALQAYHQALELSPQKRRVRMSLGQLYLAKLALENAEERANTLVAVITLYHEILLSDPENMFVHYYLGNSYRQLALLNRNDHETYIDLLEDSLCHYQEAETIRANVPNFPQSQSIVWSQMAEEQTAQGHDAGAALDAANACIRRAITINPKYGHSYNTAIIMGGRHIRNQLMDLDLGERILSESRDWQAQAQRHMSSYKNVDYSLNRVLFYRCLSLYKCGQPFQAVWRELNNRLRTQLNEDPDNSTNLALMVEVLFFDRVTAFKQDRLAPDSLEEVLFFQHQTEHKNPWRYEPHINRLRLHFLAALAALDHETAARRENVFLQAATRFHHEYPHHIVAQSLQLEFRVWKALQERNPEAAETAFTDLRELAKHAPKLLVYTLDLNQSLQNQTRYRWF